MTDAGADGQKGAIEGDRPDDEQQGNRNAGGLDDQGQPNAQERISEDVIGANVDSGERDAGVAGAAVDATETGRT